MSLHELDNGNGSGLPAPTTYALWGDSNTGDGVVGTSNGDTGVYGRSNLAGSIGEDIVYGGTGVFGVNDQIVGTGVQGQANGDNGTGVWGISVNGYGVFGTSTSGFGVSGTSTDGFGVAGSSGSSIGVKGDSGSGTGVYGNCNGGYGVTGAGGNVGVYAHNSTVAAGNDAYLASQCCAGDFYGLVYLHNDCHIQGNLQVDGTLNKPGGMFQIDHPLNPARKYLSHSFVESPDMKNIYDGTLTLDANGEAFVELPNWFEALNSDFRYQLTPIGAPGPNLYIAEEIINNRFKIAGGTPFMKVSWLVTGIRHDAWAKAHRIPVEEDKPASEQGYYLHPELHGESEEKHVRQVRYPEMIQLMQLRKSAV